MSFLHAQRRTALIRLASLPLAAAPTVIGLVAGAPAARASTGPAGAGSRAGTTAPVRPTLLVLGDSLSAEYGLRRGSGWVALLAERLASHKPPWAVFNASISGETTAGGATRLPALLAEHRPRVVLIELGGNDALRGLDLAATTRNLEAMVVAAQAAGARVMLAGMKVPPNYGRAYTERFAQIFPTLARARGCALLPFLLEGIADRFELFQPDRIHPAEAAQTRILGNVWPVLAPLLARP